MYICQITDSKIISKSSTSWGELDITAAYWVQLQAYGGNGQKNSPGTVSFRVFYVTVITGFLGQQKGFRLPFHSSYRHEHWVHVPTGGKELWAWHASELVVWMSLPNRGLPRRLSSKEPAWRSKPEHWDNPEGRDGEGGGSRVQDRGHMYTHSWFMSMYGKNHYNIVK